MSKNYRRKKKKKHQIVRAIVDLMDEVDNDDERLETMKQGILPYMPTGIKDDVQPRPHGLLCIGVKEGPGRGHLDLLVYDVTSFIIHGNQLDSLL